MKTNGSGPIQRLRALLRPTATPPARQPVLPPRRATVCDHAASHHRAVIEAARALPEGTPASPELLAAIAAEVAARRHGAGLEDGPAMPRLSGLEVRHSNLPDWWEDGGSLMLAPANHHPVEVLLGLMAMPAHNALLVVGAGVTPPAFHFTGPDALVVIGDGVGMLMSSVAVGSGSTLLVGESTTSTWMMSADVRNDGMLIIGADCMIAAGINFMTDDSHAIRDAETDARVNLRGGRIVVEEHVWIGDQTRIMGDARIGTGGVVGATSFVKNIHLPPHHVSAGRPARPVRSGIVWTREDAP